MLDDVLAAQRDCALAAGLRSAVVRVETTGVRTHNAVEPATGPRPATPPFRAVPVHSRWRSSSVTFGPAGRVVATVLVLLPFVLAIFVNALFIVAAAIWLFTVPTALRSIWARVRIGERELSDPGPSPAIDPEDGIAARQGPRRW